MALLEGCKKRNKKPKANPDLLMTEYINMVHKHGWVVAHNTMKDTYAPDMVREVEQIALRKGHTYRAEDGRVLVNYNKWSNINE